MNARTRRLLGGTLLTLTLMAGHAGLAVAACVQPPNTTMVAWYPFDEAAGPKAANLATGNSGTWVNGPSPIAGKVAGALHFDGLNDYVESPSSLVTNFGPAQAPAFCSGGYSTCQGNFSIDAWIRIPNQTPPSTMIVVEKRAGNPPAIKGYSLFVLQYQLPGLRLGIQMADGVGSGYDNFLSPTAVPALNDGQWHHIAVTVNRSLANGITFFHNGAPIGNANPTTRLGSLANNSPLRIGTRTTAPPLSGWFQGDIDELEIWNRALTPIEVRGIAAAGPSGKCK